MGLNHDTKAIEQTRMVVLITGSTGRLGPMVVKLLPDSLLPAHAELDISSMEQVASYVKKTGPDVIIHCAAVTDVRRCENEKALAWATNVEGTANLVKACEKSGDEFFFVFVSTACVFHGDRGGYAEGDTPYPKNFYSLTKLLGEQLVRSSRLKKALVVRTNFTSRAKWSYPRAFVDRFGTYLYSDDVATVLKLVVEERLHGVIHVCGDKKMSMYELAKLTTPDVQPMTLSEYCGPPLTVDMSLRSVRLEPFRLGFASA